MVVYYNKYDIKILEFAAGLEAKTKLLEKEYCVHYFWGQTRLWFPLKVDLKLGKDGLTKLVEDEFLKKRSCIQSSNRNADYTTIGVCLDCVQMELPPVLKCYNVVKDSEEEKKLKELFEKDPALVHPD